MDSWQERKEPRLQQKSGDVGKNQYLEDLPESWDLTLLIEVSTSFEKV